jgi:2-methylisocitrate lyase-like PEP mutase family enzyme
VAYKNLWTSLQNQIIKLKRQIDMASSLNAELRKMLVPGAGIIMPGAGNALSARIIEATGHKCLLVSGAAVTNNFLGMPDIGLISLAELVNHVSAIRNAVNIPILVDADTGFGNAINVRHTVRSVERAGANAIFIEDQTYPKRCGHFDNQEIIPKDEMVQKIKAAVDARQDPNLMLLARTDARSVEGLEAAYDRARAYQEAGADMLFIEAPRSAQELESIPREVPGIHICNMVIGGKTPLLTREELGRMGYAIVAYANAALQASMLGMQNVLQHLNDKGSIEGAEDQIMMFADRQKLLDGDYYRDLASRYGARPQ